MRKKKASRKRGRAAPNKKSAKGIRGSAGVAPQPAAVQKKYFCEPDMDREVPREFAQSVFQLEQSLGLPVWLLVQGGEREWDFIAQLAKRFLFDARQTGLQRDQPVALLIDSRGGSARCAYEIASLLRKHCGGFLAVVPRRAKSAATLLSLGADEILLGEFGELGPLDVQILDPDREDWISGLDEVQSLERLHAFAMTAFDQTMFLLQQRTGMKIGTLMPHVTRLVTAMTQPLFEKQDAVRYTQMSRALKVGEEYARRLLMPKYEKKEANAIACRLVGDYPDHSFVIDQEEAKRIGLKLQNPTDDQLRILDDISGQLSGLTAIGQITEKEQQP